MRIDTNRDGINVDCCKNVRITGCSVNSPWDDGICLKSSFALGEARATENVTISNCYVTGGYALGTMLDGTLKRMDANSGCTHPGDVSDTDGIGLRPSRHFAPVVKPLNVLITCLALT